ncbi:MAG: subtype B tannase [Lachnospiraceae bacterium]
MNFDKNAYTVESLTVGVHTIRYRQFADLLYADLPANAAYQRMHIYAPEGFYEGESINGYTLATAPVFMPNQVGGYMPGEPAAPGETQEGSGIPNTVFCALEHGYVVAAPAIRGRVQQDENKTYTGKAPACIVDYKAAVRYLHAFAKDLPGDEEKIITNGTSAGGALSSLVGSSGNHPDYEPYLKAIGAADAGDEIFAASCYCPIINLEHADAAYEWQFLGVNEFRRMQMNLTEGGRPEFSAVDGDMTPSRCRPRRTKRRFSRSTSTVSG